MRKKLTYKQAATVMGRLVTTGQKVTLPNVKKVLTIKANDVLLSEYIQKWKKTQTKPKEFIEIDNLSKSKIKYLSREELQKEMTRRTSELEKSLALMRATLESTGDGILMLLQGGKLVDWNQKFIDMFHLPEDIAKSKDQRRGFEYVLTQVKNPEELMQQIAYLYDHPDVQGDMGESHFNNGLIMERYSQPLIVGNRNVGRVWSFRDVTQRKKAEEALRLRERAIEQSTDGVIITEATPDYKIIYANPAFERITGFTGDEIIGRECFFLKTAGKKEQAAVQKLNLAFKEQREDQAIFRVNRKDGKVFWSEMHISPVRDPEGNVSNFVGVMVDITERKIMEEQLLHQATHDFLTDLPNRALLIDRIQQAILNAKRENTAVGILFLDLDRFKLINDSLGHDMGDKLLTEVSERLKKCVREVDTVARVGGDEFVIILQFVKNEEDLISLSQKMLKTIATPFKIDGTELNITTSIGLSLYPNDAVDLVNLLKNADMAMYQAKDLGRNNFQFYTEEMNKRVRHHLELEQGLRIAIENKELEAYYQPCFDLNTNKVFGVEALIRWRHPKLGLIPPNEFIHLAEENNLILPIGEIVLRQACLQQKMWLDQGMELTVAINISGKQLKQVNFLEIIERIFKETKVNPKYLEFEVTETIFLDNLEEITKTLEEVRKMGIKIAIDDFGTGYSSLGYLNKLPLNKLKIDISFVRGLPEEQNSRAITLAIIALAKNLNLKVIAEGVEKLEQSEFLRQHGCDEVQGFYYAKPMEKDDATKFIKDQIDKK